MLELTYEGHLRVGQTGKWETSVLRKRDKTYKERGVQVYGTFQGTIGSSWLPTGKGFRMSIRRRKGNCTQDTQPKVLCMEPMNTKWRILTRGVRCSDLHLTKRSVDSVGEWIWWANLEARICGKTLQKWRWQITSAPTKAVRGRM